MLSMSIISGHWRQLPFLLGSAFDVDLETFVEQGLDEGAHFCGGANVRRPPTAHALVAAKRDRGWHAFLEATAAAGYCLVPK